MPTCKIDQDLIPTSCKDIATGGLTGRFWLINSADLARTTLTLGADGEITAFTFAGTTGEILAFRFETPKGSLVIDDPITRNDGGFSGLTHTITGVIADQSMKMKASLESLFNFNTVSAIVETQAAKPATSGTGDVKSPPYVLYGSKNGMELSTTTISVADQGTNNSIQITLTTPTTSSLEYEYPINCDMSTADIEALETALP